MNIISPHTLSLHNSINNYIALNFKNGYVTGTIVYSESFLNVWRVIVTNATYKGIPVDLSGDMSPFEFHNPTVVATNPSTQAIKMVADLIRKIAGE